MLNRVSELVGHFDISTSVLAIKCCLDISQLGVQFDQDYIRTVRAKIKCPKGK